jgi:hypothetical protein
MGGAAAVGRQRGPDRSADDRVDNARRLVVREHREAEEAGSQAEPPDARRHLPREPPPAAARASASGAASSSDVVPIPAPPSMARTPPGLHHPGDVAAGALIGLASAAFVRFVALRPFEASSPRWAGPPIRSCARCGGPSTP